MEPLENLKVKRILLKMRGAEVRRVLCAMGPFCGGNHRARTRNISLRECGVPGAGLGGEARVPGLCFCNEYHHGSLLVGTCFFIFPTLGAGSLLLHFTDEETETQKDRLALPGLGRARMQAEPGSRCHMPLGSRLRGCPDPEGLPLLEPSTCSPQPFLAG